ncbi:MAG: hypothetical protein P8181_14890 [bacterium]
MEGLLGPLVWVALVGGVASVILIELPRIVVWCLELVEHYHKLKARRSDSCERGAPADAPVASSEDGGSRN